MHQLVKTLLIFGLFLSLVACQQSIDREPDLTGYVVEKMNDSILIANEESIDLSANGGVSNYYQMIWFSNPPKELSYGDKVHIWYDEVEESYPSRSIIVDYCLIDSDTHEGAALTESEVLNQVLAEYESKPSELFAVHTTDFNPRTKTWLISLIEIWTQDIVTIEVSEQEQL